MEYSNSLSIVYFGIGFTVAAALTMLGLTFVRPYIDQDTPDLIRTLCLLAPLISGVFYGYRVQQFGRKDGLRLGAALKRAIKP